MLHACHAAESNRTATTMHGTPCTHMQPLRSHTHSEPESQPSAVRMASWTHTSHLKPQEKLPGWRGWLQHARHEGWEVCW